MNLSLADENVKGSFIGTENECSSFCFRLVILFQFDALFTSPRAYLRWLEVRIISMICSSNISNRIKMSLEVCGRFKLNWPKIDNRANVCRVHEPINKIVIVHIFSRKFWPIASRQSAIKNLVFHWNHFQLRWKNLFNIMNEQKRCRR